MKFKVEVRFETFNQSVADAIAKDLKCLMDHYQKQIETLDGIEVDSPVEIKE